MSTFFGKILTLPIYFKTQKSMPCGLCLHRNEIWSKMLGQPLLVSPVKIPVLAQTLTSAVTP